MGKKKNNINKVKNKNTDTIDNEIVRFIIIFFIIAVVVIGLYFLSKSIVDKRNSDNNTTETIEIAYDKLNVGMIFNRPYDEYYVMIYDSNIEQAVYYSTILTKYKNTDNSIKIYYCDLSEKVNSVYYSETENGNTNASNINELSFGNLTLIKIKNGKIALYLEDIEDIKKELK
ncbi:MAG: hypothetical protein ACI4XR_00135 [Bacilli bacterium]